MIIRKVTVMLEQVVTTSIEVWMSAMISMIGGMVGMTVMQTTVAINRSNNDSNRNDNGSLDIRQ